MAAEQKPDVPDVCSWISTAATSTPPSAKEFLPLERSTSDDTSTLGMRKRQFRGEHLTNLSPAVRDSPHDRLTAMRTPVSAHLGAFSSSLQEGSEAGLVRQSPWSFPRRVWSAPERSPASTVQSSGGNLRRWSSGLSWSEDETRVLAANVPSPVLGGSKPERFVTLSEPELLPVLCCQFPGVLLFGTLLVLLVSAFLHQATFFVLTAVLTAYVAFWSGNLAISCTVGAWNMRRDCAKDWHVMLQSVQAERSDASVMHIVILPNYKEDEQMMWETLSNIARSPLAREHIRIVLGMEEREGPSGQEKAERLVERASELFADVFASFHPAGREGEIAGKSSNTQWAYRSMLQRYKEELASWDPAHVFLSVGDADTMWNPQYFDALAYQGLTLPKEEAVWAIYQPPLLLFRNLFAVPGPTRLSGFGTFLFELAGLANQRIGVHFCFSSYSLTLALASHRMICGWDTDVIAEDHHMFCKCFFGALWEAVDAGEDRAAEPIEPKVRLYPVWLPAEGYLVESSEGYWASCVARFQQARRHSQGVAELGYAALQYARLLGVVGPGKLSVRAHLQICSILLKMSTVHIWNSVQAAALVLGAAMALPGIVGWLFSHGNAWLKGEVLSMSGSESGTLSTLATAKLLLFVTFGPLPPVGMLSAATLFMVVKDVIEGRYLRPVRPANGAGGPEEPGGSEGGMSFCESVALAAKMQHDMLALSEPTIVVYGMIPEMLAAWSLFRSGTHFEYIVAAKPADRTQEAAPAAAG